MLTSIILPSYGRPEKLKSVLMRLWDTCAIPAEVEIICIVDDDKESFDAAEPYCVEVCRHQKRKGIGIASARGLRESVGDLIHASSDDFWYGQDWLARAKAAHKAKLNGYGYLALNDQYHTEGELQSIFLIDRKFCIDHMNGSISIPHYKHYFTDVEFWERAKRSGHYAYCEDAVVAHRHYSITGQKDALDYELEKYFEEDSETYVRRQAAGFPDDWEPTIRK